MAAHVLKLHTMHPERQAVILAGGLGTRLKPLTDAIPKPLLPVGEKSILEIQMHRLREHGFTDITLATNYKSDYIESFMGDGSRYGVRLHISREEKPLGTCGPLTLVKERLGERFAVMNGDILTTIDFTALWDFSLRTGADLTVVTKEMWLPYAFGKVESEGDFLVGVEEKPNVRLEIIAGIYILTQGAFDFIPDDSYFGMDGLIKAMLAAKRPVAKYLMKDLWLDIGQPPDYAKAQDLYEEHFR